MPSDEKKLKKRVYKEFDKAKNPDNSAAVKRTMPKQIDEDLIDSEANDSLQKDIDEDEQRGRRKKKAQPPANSTRQPKPDKTTNSTVNKNKSVEMKPDKKPKAPPGKRSQ